MNNAPLGIFDSGIGGLTVAKEIYRLLPNESTVYVGDTARVPYGNRSPEKVTEFSRQIVNFLITQNVKAIIIACSTATAQALPTLIKEFNLPLFGVIEPTVKKALSLTKNNHIGVIGTRGTIKSHRFQELLTTANSNAIITTQICPLFVPLAEEGIVSGNIAESVSHLYLDQFKNQPLDTLILGCTHYPLLETTIQKTVGQQITLINPGRAVAEELTEKLATLHLITDTNKAPTHEYYVTDNPATFNSLAQTFLGHSLERPAQQIVL